MFILIFRIDNRKQTFYQDNEEFNVNDFSPILPNIDNVMDYIFQLHTVEHQIAKNDNRDKHRLNEERQTTITLPDGSDAQAIVNI